MVDVTPVFGVLRLLKAINRNLYICGTVPAILQLMTTGYYDSSREGQKNFSMSME